MYWSLSLVAVGIHVHEWAVIRLPSFHETLLLDSKVFGDE
jgi:hypothetical protein